MAVPKYFDSAGDMKLHLQTLLDAKEKQLQQAGTLGQRVLAQQMELEERIRQLQELDADKDDEEELDADSRERYKELADTLVSWDAENAQLSSAFGKSSASPSMPVAELPREEPERMKAASSSSAAQSRRAKNAAHRADDVEFAFEIGSGLLNEVRRLQSLLGERDKAIQDMKEEKDDLEASIESLRTALKQQEQSADKFKEENWNLEVTLQELRTQLSNSQSTAARLETEHKRLTKLLANTRDTSEQFKNENTQLQTTIEEMTAKHETDVALARKHAAGLARDKSDLQQTVDTLKAEVARAGRRFPRGSPITPNGSEANDFLTPGGASGYGDDVFSNPASTNTRRGKMSDMSMLGAYDDEFGNDLPDSPDASPLNRTSPFRAANHPNNEIEALQQRLAHAQRQISTLKGTLQREKKEKLDLKRKYGVDGPEDEDEDGEDEVGDDTVGVNTTVGESQSKRRATPFKVGRGRNGIRGRMRGGARGGRGGGMTLQERLSMAAHDHDEDGFSPERDSSPLPAVPAIPIRFTNADDDDEGMFDAPDAYGGIEGEEEDRVPDEMDFQASPSPVPSSNRNSVASVTSVEGMDPVFANVLRRTPSTSSVQASPLRQSLLRRSARGRGGAGTSVGVGRRTRGGAAYHDGRPPSLVGQPEDLAQALGGSVGGSPMSIRDGSTMDIMEELAGEVIETAEFGCQTEPEPEPVKESHPEPEPVPVIPEKVMADMGVQHEPEPAPPPPPAPVMMEFSVQTEPPPVVERDEVAVQHQPRLVSASTNTQPPAMAEMEVQTVKPVEDEMLRRRTTITQNDVSIGSSHGDSTIKNAPGRTFLAAVAAGEDVAFDEEEDDGEETETGADTETDTDNDYQDARQSIVMSTPSASQDDFHSMMTMTDNEVSDEEEGADDIDDGESIKVSRLPSRNAQRVSVASTASLAVGETSSFYGTPAGSAAAVVPVPTVTYDSKSVEVDLIEPPKVEPKPEVKEMSIQTDEWTPPVPFPPAVPSSSAPIPSSPVMYRVGSTKQQFQFVPPAPPAALPAPSSSSLMSSPTSSLFKETSTGFATIIKQRSSEDRRQSIDSAVSSVLDDGASIVNRSRAPSGNTLIDKTKPPMMTLPPPPRAPPPPGSMPPPSFIPERRIPTSSSGSYDMPPPRPSSPPPPELIQRATTPTFGSALSVPSGRGSGFSLRQAGSSMPPSQAGLRQPPSTSSFRSAANATSYAQQHGLHPSSQMSFKERRELSSTSLPSERSIASPRSSMSSEHHPYMNRSQHSSNNQNVNPNGVATPNKTLLAGDPMGLANRSQASNPTDPAVIHAITQTMIGEFLYKYTRKAIGKGYGTARHRRFFWVHPYTKTLYWSSADPNSTNVSESSAKSAYIEGVRQVLDPNPMPPGLYQYSVVVSTPQREMKFTAPTKERHDIWLNSLKYLLARPAPTHITSPGNATVVPESPGTGDEYEDEQHLDVNASPRSQRSGRSMRKDTWNTTPRGKRSRSQLSVGGSIGRRAGTPAAEYLRWNGPESPYSPTKSFVDVPANDDEEDEDLDFELHGDSLSDEGFEGLENVRACCDGRHTVGHSGKHHHHHHHHQHDGSQNGDHTGSVGPVRPVSPSAWSFRSRTGSANSHEGTASSFFSWSKAKTEDGKLRFGSRRSNKTVLTQAP